MWSSAAQDGLGQPVGGGVALSVEHYCAIRLFLSDSCGIELGDSKQYLVKSRLSPLLKKLEVNDFAGLITVLQTNRPAATKVKSAVIDAMTTNETFWFRDELQFVELKESVLPTLFREKNARVNIWSAACSTGQEPYSISMIVHEALQACRADKGVQIVGTDISETVLQEAAHAVYSELAISRGVNAMCRERYFQADCGGYRVNAEIAGRVRFQPFNLLKPFSALGRFDIIFCRNVLIYFSERVKRDILARMVDCLEPGGYLFLSSTEAMPNDIKSLEPVASAKTRYYRKNAG